MRVALVALILAAGCAPQKDWPDPPELTSAPCLVSPFLSEIHLTGNAGLAAQLANPEQNVIFTRADFENLDGPPAFLSLSLWEGAGVFAGGYQTGSFVIDGKETDLQSCGMCFAIGTESLFGPSRQSYFAYFGAVTLEEVLATPGGWLTAEITDLRLREVMYAEDGAQVDAPGPCQIAVDKVTIDMSVQSID